MADPTPVNGQVTDAVTQTNVKVVGEAPAEAMATVYQTMAHSISLSMQNAVAQQQQMNAISTATTAQAVNALMATPPAAAARSADELLTGNAVAQQLLDLLTSLVGGKQAGDTSAE